MKRLLCAVLALAMIASFAACGSKKNNDQGNNPSSDKSNEQTQQSQGGAANQPSDNGTVQENAPAPVEKYAEHGVSFQVPNEWKNNFIAKYYEHGSGDTAFSTIEFLSRINKNDVKVMTIASFGKKQWETIKAGNKDAEDMKIGTSKDGSKIFTLRIEDQVFENENDTKAYKVIRDAAEKLKSKIKITE